MEIKPISKTRLFLICVRNWDDGKSPNMYPETNNLLANCEITCNEEFITRIGVLMGLLVLVTGGIIDRGNWRYDN
jgi:hypothetical protein